jgi:hypothetical protein
MYKITTNHDRSWNGAVVLIGIDGCTGPWDKNSTLPHVPKGAIAYAYVKRYFLNKPLPTDPGLSTDEGKNLAEECLKYLTQRDLPGSRHKAELIAEGKKHGIEIPEPEGVHACHVQAKSQ